MTLLEHDILAARILIVDSQEAGVNVLERLLTEVGHTAVSSTPDPLQVCALHHRHDFDLILLDLPPPPADGLHVMASLRAGAENGGVLVMVITAQPAQQLRAMQSGARDFISKPFDPLEVQTRIHNMLELRLLYRRMESSNALTERTVLERTAELRESEARYRNLTELASDWYWEQDEHGKFSKVSGPVQEMLGLQVDPLADTGSQEAAATGDGGWNEAERALLQAAVAARRPFLDYPFSRTNADGSTQQFRVSGEPIFSRSCHFKGYRGIGVETTPRLRAVL